MRSWKLKKFFQKRMKQHLMSARKFHGKQKLSRHTSCKHRGLFAPAPNRTPSSSDDQLIRVLIKYMRNISIPLILYNSYNISRTSEKTFFCNIPSKTIMPLPLPILRCPIPNQLPTTLFSRNKLLT